VADQRFSHKVVRTLHSADLQVEDVRRVVTTALAEDLHYGPDATSQACVPGDAVAEAVVRLRRPGMLAGVPLAQITAALASGHQQRLNQRPQLITDDTLVIHTAQSIRRCRQLNATTSFKRQTLGMILAVTVLLKNALKK
jgi:hypothetical protein